ncbi:aldose reductase-like [Ctenocephalides felis]|uniref:aldose reductase-like n=1 Tax=Ctenocephalides felis TaxID=7515 RepID=UPI000E6E3B52|nr:aldose reductase-like [Ctenocephalides felis]
MSLKPKEFVTFNNGNQFPVLGLGTWKSEPGKVDRAVRDAIDLGYRHIDCAHVYGNEKEVGSAIKSKIEEGVVKREDLYITSKLWNTFHRPDLVKGALQTTLDNLGLKYLDLYLIHWPMAYKEEEDLFPTVNGQIQFSDVDYLDTWTAMEALYNDGLVKNIGVSNFNSKQLQRLLDHCKIKPVTNQVELHPYLNQSRLRQFCQARGIQITSYSPLGSPDRPWAKPEDKKVLDDQWLNERAKALGKTPAQLTLRWNLQLGNIVIPKSVTKSRIAENFNIFDFELSEDDMECFSKLDENYRTVPMTGALGHKHHPFENEEF